MDRHEGPAERDGPQSFKHDFDNMALTDLEEGLGRHLGHLAKPFAKTTFFSDDRAQLAKLMLPTLILQSKHDSLASTNVGEYMNNAIPDAKMHIVDAYGHCLHMTNPATVFTLFEDFAA